MIIYNKLVRDKIPALIEAQNESCQFDILTDEDYGIELNRKLAEETEEYLNNPTLEELADIVEVVYAILDFQAIPLTKFHEKRVEKLHKNGGFQEKIYLKSKTAKESN